MILLRKDGQQRTTYICASVNRGMRLRVKERGERERERMRERKKREKKRERQREEREYEREILLEEDGQLWTKYASECQLGRRMRERERVCVRERRAETKKMIGL